MCYVSEQEWSEITMERDIKEVIGVLMRVLDGAEVSRQRVGAD